VAGKQTLISADVQVFQTAHRLITISVLGHHRIIGRRLHLPTSERVSVMERLKRITDERGISIFDVEDVVALLAHQRKEAFEGERAIRLFQFRAWILCPGTNEANAAKWAALIAAVKYLDRMEEDYFADEESERLYREDRPTGVDLTHKPPQTTWRIETLGKNNRTYREIYDQLIARRGGLLALLDAPSPADFDRAIQMQFDRMHIISDLIDYRIRYIQHRSDNQKVAADPNGANHNHALFFVGGQHMRLRADEERHHRINRFRSKP
jgi:hypothetical protein